MNLQEIPFRIGFRPACYGCDVRIDERARLFADLDGPPWRAYYCGPCAARLRARAIAYQMADERDAKIMADLTRAEFDDPNEEFYGLGGYEGAGGG